MKVDVKELSVGNIIGVGGRPFYITTLRRDEEDIGGSFAKSSHPTIIDIHPVPLKGEILKNNGWEDVGRSPLDRGRVWKKILKDDGEDLDVLFVTLYEEDEHPYNREEGGWMKIYRFCMSDITKNAELYVKGQWVHKLQNFFSLHNIDLELVVK